MTMELKDGLVTLEALAQPGRSSKTGALAIHIQHTALGVTLR